MRRHPGHHRRQRHRHQRRPHVHRADRVRRGGSPDPLRTAVVRSWTSPASRSSACGRARSATTGRPFPSTRRACTAPRTAVGGSAAWGARTPASRPRRPGRSQAFFLWAPLHWDDRCTHFGVFEDAHAQSLALRRRGAPGVRVARRHPRRRGSRRSRSWRQSSTSSTTSPARAAPVTPRIALVHDDGRREDIDLEPLICFRMKGIGYMHPEWGHGMWKGELAYAGESWKVADLDPMAYENQHLQQVVRATLRRPGRHRRARADRLRPPRPLRLQGAPRPRLTYEPASFVGSYAP